MTRHEAFFLVGPTAVGKTEVAQRAAEQAGWDIVSADSMLVYRGMDIGTAKPDPGWRGRVRYWCVDVIDPPEPFSVGAFRPLAVAAIRRIAEEGRQAIVVGGTGLYIRSLIDGLVPSPAANASARNAAQQILTEGGPERLAERLREIAPDAYAALKDRRNPRRLVRAYELAESGGLPARRTWASASGSPPIVGLRLPPERLRERIESRVRRMFADGLLDEVRRLVDAGLDPGATALQAIGYAEALACLRGECSRDAAEERTIVRTRQFAKRQMTWFRHQANVVWVDAGDIADTAQRVMDLWRRLGPVPIAGA